MAYLLTCALRAEVRESLVTRRRATVAIITERPTVDVGFGTGDNYTTRVTNCYKKKGIRRVDDPYNMFLVNSTGISAIISIGCFVSGNTLISEITPSPTRTPLISFVPLPLQFLTQLTHCWVHGKAFERCRGPFIANQGNPSPARRRAIPSRTS